MTEDSKNKSVSANETLNAVSTELKKERIQQSWQAAGEGYVGTVQTVQDPNLYNQLRNYSSPYLSENDELWFAPD